MSLKQMKLLLAKGFVNEMRHGGEDEEEDCSRAKQERENWTSVFSSLLCSTSVTSFTLWSKWKRNRNISAKRENSTSRLFCSYYNHSFIPDWIFIYEIQILTIATDDRMSKYNEIRWKMKQQSWEQTSNKPPPWWCYTSIRTNCWPGWTPTLQSQGDST